MKERSVMIVRKAVLLLGMLLLLVTARSQCPQLYDYYGVPSSAPEWFSCTGNNFSLLVATPNTVGNYTIDWGDGSQLHSGAALVPPMTVSHVYASAVAEYTVTFTELSSGCVITGTLTMEESSSASIQIPIGGLTQVCAPEAVEFINSSTNVSPNTVFTWDFGDNSPITHLRSYELGANDLAHLPAGDGGLRDHRQAHGPEHLQHATGRTQLRHLQPDPYLGHRRRDHRTQRNAALLAGSHGHLREHHRSQLLPTG
ncbi:MAG: hypothetical protein R2818_11595 [Flavobacteriales bacterium]